MISINLLPDEYRRARRTPIRLMGAVAAGVTINVSLLSFWIWNAFGPVAEAESQLEVLESDASTLGPLVDFHKSLEKEKRLFESREGTLDEIVSQRISWTEKIDQLVDVINRGGDGDERYLIWMDDLNVVQTDATKLKKGATSGGNLRANAHSGDGDFGLVANFFEDLQNSPFAESFQEPAPPEGQRNTKDPDLIPAEVFSFTLDYEMEPPQTVAAAKKPAEKKEG
ncbi:PilN domain-containing protein [Engelhardtia mirabilis]|uniref:Fimbrial assembly protein (PilN) n=1 Tax=Engelhardtia mirabilis TaxID=2528011 RepID=A0A518BP99_9BACT|nr:hypothetical protein Pla133_39040 [Planctomycetes bacterium Pla133]QDV03128.1 hypothetical protein Pla86_39030 [Planctomycetes bacterium Pla86]